MQAAQDRRRPSAGARRPPGSAGLRRHLSSALLILLLCVLALGIGVGAGFDLPTSGHLPDTDDYMRMTQVFRWLDGAAWWDVAEPRVDPPSGLAMHWSRLPDLPLAGLVALLEPWLGRLRAALLAASLVPPLLLAACLGCLTWTARPVLGRGRAVLAAILAALSLPLTVKFQPGHVDHDNWQLIFATLALGALVRIAIKPSARLPPVLAAAVFALALWVGGECLPWLIGFNLTLALLWVRRGGTARLWSALQWAASLQVLALALLVAQPLAAGPVCDGFGIFYAALPAFCILFWAGLLAGGRGQAGWRGRAAWAAVSGGLTMALLLAAFPMCRGGPFGEVAPRLRLVWQQHSGETQSLLDLFPERPWMWAFVVLAPIMALVFSARRAVAGPVRAQTAWLAFPVWLTIALGLTALEIRVIGFAFLLASVPLAGQVLSVGRRLAGWPRRVWTAFATALLGPALLVVLPPAALQASTIAARSPPGREDCDLAAAASTLDRPGGLGARPRLIIAPIDDGPELLFRTPHLVLAAPYHRNVDGNLAVYDFFAASDPEQARHIAVARHAELVMFCPGRFRMWLPADPGSPSFRDALASGKTPPWLRPVPLPPASRELLFEVVDPDGAPGARKP
ncbi:MAG: hypothetical protein U1E53_23845 [Dongiaceae bacterium]